MGNAVVKTINNILENDVKTFDVAEGLSVEQIIRQNFDDAYSSLMVECYDCETGETFFAPVSDGPNQNVIVTVNGKDSQLDYVTKENDVVNIVFLPTSSDTNWSWTGAFVGAFEGALTGAWIGTMIAPGLGTLIGAGIGAVAGFFAGGLLWDKFMSLFAKDGGSHKNGLDTDNLPDIRGASNTPLLNNVFPAVIGKILTTPYIIGSAYNEIYGNYGEEIYIQALYLVGYSPLRITDLKLGEQLLAHNQSWDKNPNMENVFHGLLYGTNSAEGVDVGDIVTTWSSNDISVEILQQGQNGEPIDWGAIFPYAKLQDDINANILYIVDDLEHKSIISYKGALLKNGLRNNPVKFTRQCPLSARIELNVPNGLFKTYSESDDDGDSEVKYEKIPVWMALQWRVYSKNNTVSDGDAHGVISGEMNPESDNYWWDPTADDGKGAARTQERGWHTFKNVNGIDREVSFDGTFSGTTNLYLEKLHETSSEYEGIAGVSFDITYQNLMVSISEPYDEDLDVSVTIETTANGSVKFVRYGHRKDIVSYEPLETEETVTVTGKILAGETSVQLTSQNVVGSDTYREPHVVKRDESMSVESGRFTSKIKSITINHASLTKSVSWEDATLSSSKTYTDKAVSWSQNSGINPQIYTSAARSEDKNAHTNNRYEAGNINKGWLGAEVFNFKELCGTWDNQEGISEFRLVTEVDFEKWARENFHYESEAEFIHQFQEYFLSNSNTAKSIEVRAVRISPNYINETQSSEKKSAASYNDIITWKTLTCTVFNEDKLINEKVIEPVRPLSEEDMRKHCVIAIRAKTDNTDQIGNSLRKFSCTSQSFAPYYDSELKQWFPKEVNASTKYYKPYDVENQTRGAEITREQFIQDRQSEPKIKSVQRKNGNDFVKNLVNNVIRVNENKDSKGRYIIPKGYTLNENGEKIWTDTYIEEDGKKLWNKNAIRYCENNVASCILLAGIGAHVGVNALSYADYDMLSLAKVFEFCKKVTDGSTYTRDGYHYEHDGTEKRHNKGDLVEVYFTANGYLYEAKKLEDVLSALSIAGRCVYTRNKSNQLTFVIDKPESYHVALINQGNTLSSSYTISYADLPSGIRIPFKDENDGFEQNTIYAMQDGETEHDHTAPIEQYGIDFVTNPYQIWSLGRYVLANRIMNREIVTKKIGMEGYSIGLGNIVCLQDDTMMIGSDPGGRITRLIEDDDYIYGCVLNTTYHFTGDLDGDSRVKLGIVIMQPGEYKESRIITLRLAPLGTQIGVDDEVFTVKKGQTNVVVFESRLSKNGIVTDNENAIAYVYNPQVDNIVGFGEIGQEYALYRVIRIKPDNKHNYELTLLKYEPKLYEYGRALPSFQNNITPPNDMGDGINLSNSATPADLVSAVKQASDITVGKQLNIISENGTVFKNGSPSYLDIEAVATGYTPSEYKWYKGDTLLTDEDEAVLRVTLPGVYKCHAENEFMGFDAYITITAVSDGDDGKYMDYIFAVGAFGLTDEQARQLTWYDAPPVVGDGQCLYMASKWIEG